MRTIKKLFPVLAVLIVLGFAGIALFNNPVALTDWLFDEADTQYSDSFSTGSTHKPDVSSSSDLQISSEPESTGEKLLDPDGYYYSLDDVIMYIDAYDQLPPNYLTKDEARNLGWNSGSVEKYLDGAAIGGDTFGNREGLLPKASGRTYTECDIDTLRMDTRGAKRLIFSNDRLYFYTADHYESFTEVYISESREVQFK